MSFELENFENFILAEIKGDATRDQIANTYKIGIVSMSIYTIDWAKINKAIIEKWSRSGLEYIKKLAWKEM